jgi:hypothetical protein
VVTITYVTFNSEGSLIERFKSLGDLTKVALVIIYKFIFANQVLINKTEVANTVFKL